MRNTIQKVIQYCKKILSQTINNQKGVVLPIILMAIGGLSLIGAAAVSVSSGEMNIAHNDRNYKVALNLAEAGINDAADGIAGNREILPVPLGTINNTSYSFNVGGTAFNNTGRYNVTVALPIFTTLKDVALQGASSVTVFDITSLNPGDSIVMGDATTHLMAKIGSITPGVGTEGTLNLVDGKNKPYILGQQLDPGMRIAKNFIRVTSTGEAGTGLGSTYNAPALWRASSTINATPNITPPVAGPGVIRSTLTLQAEYTIQEINFIGNLGADVSPLGANSKLNGPVLISDAGPPANQLGQLSISPYAQGDYSGPIFMSTSAINAGNLKINGNSYYPTTQGINGTYPKIIPISPAAAQKADVNKILAQATTNANCYQKACNVAGATQQIYYLNGYQVDVLPYRPTTAGTAGFPMSIDPDSVQLVGTNIVFSFKINTTFATTSADDVNINVNTGTPASNTNQTPTLISVSQPTNPINGIGINGQNISFANNTTYYAGTVVTVSFPAGNDGYLRIWDNNSNNGIPPGGSAAYSNGVWVTALGAVESQEKQGDVNWLGDAGAGTHSDVDTGHNHSTILTTKPTKYWRGIYATNNNASGTTTTWISSGEGAVLFGGRTNNSTAWVVGDTTSYYTTYYIHTNAVGSCDDHDIKMVSLTKVTYLGISTKCTGTDQKRLFLYETIWNHTPVNTFNKGVQSDDTDTSLGFIPHKGYFKWVREKDINDNELFKGIEVLMGDKEFNSVFNHSSDSRFKSSVINANIDKVRMIGWANPPLKYNNTLSRMEVSPVGFASLPDVWPTTTNPVIANSKDWDWPDMVGTRSQFTTAVNTRGFDFSNFSTVMNSFNQTTGYIEAYQTSPGNYVLPDMSTINPRTSTANNSGTGNILLYKTVINPATLWPGVWTGNSPANVAMPGNPIMNPSGLQPTVITATISGPSFTKFEIKRGSANLFFDAANGIPFNIKELKIETKGAGANITIGSSANPATVFAQKFKLESEDCGGTINFSFTGKMVASEVKFEKNVKYDVQSTMTNAPGCLSTTNNFIYLKKSNWKEIRN